MISTDLRIRILTRFEQEILSRTRESEHIEYRSLDLQYTNRSAYPAGLCHVFSSYLTIHSRCFEMESVNFKKSSVLRNVSCREETSSYKKVLHLSLLFTALFNEPENNISSLVSTAVENED